MPPAARVSDSHMCPMVTGTVPHVGGPILPPGCLTVIFAGLPSARVGDKAVCAGPPDSIAMGSPTVIVGNQQAARLGDPTVHGGVIVSGAPNIDIGVSAQLGAMMAASKSGAAFVEAEPAEE